MTEQRDVHVRDVVVPDAAVAAIAQVVLGQQVLFVDVPLCAVRRRALAGTPELRQGEPVEGVDHLEDRLVQTLLRHVVQVEPGHLLARQALDRQSGLGRPQVASVEKQRRQKTFARVVASAAFAQSKMGDMKGMDMTKIN